MLSNPPDTENPYKYGKGSGIPKEEPTMPKEDEKTSEKFLQSYVYGKHGNFHVSTCYRQSSAAIESPPWYYETFAWKLEGEKRTDWVADHSGARHEDGAYKQHIEVVKQLHEKGRFEEKDDE